MFDKNVVAARAAIAGASDEHLLKLWSLLLGGKTVFTLPPHRRSAELYCEPRHSAPRAVGRLPAPEQRPGAGALRSFLRLTRGGM